MKTNETSDPKDLDLEVEDLRDWILTALEKGADRIELRTREGTEAVGEWALSRSTTDALKLARTICRHADNDAQHIRGGAVFYVVLAFEPGQKERCGRGFLNARRGGRMSVDAPDEDGSADGLLAQLMRHTENSNKLAIGHTADVVKHYKKMLEAAYARIALLEGRLNDVGEVYEVLTTQAHERELEMMKQKQSEKKQDFFASKLNMLLPIVLSKLAAAANGKDGKEAKPLPAFQEEKMRQLVNSLRDDQVDGLMSALDPAQIALMASLYEDYKLRDPALAQNSGAPSGANTNGAAPPNGAHGHG
jgi:hypothetical protein